MRASGNLDLRGSLVRLNDGTKLLATVGSGVQVVHGTANGPETLSGQVAAGSPSVLGN